MLDLLYSLQSAMCAGQKEQQAWVADQPELTRGAQASRAPEGAQKADLTNLPMSLTLALK